MNILQGGHSMTNIKLQDFTATIHRASQHNGGQFDLIHVESLIESDQPIPSDEFWYIPSTKPIDNTIKAFLEQNKTPIVPTSGLVMEERIKSAMDIMEQARAESQEGTRDDMLTYALLASMTKANLKLLDGTPSTYLFSYDYKIYSIAPNVFEFKIILPFPGFIIPDNGDQIQLTFIAPIGAIIDETNTNGIDDAGQPVIPEYFKPNNGKKQIVAFKYQRDPIFTIRYHY